MTRPLARGDVILVPFPFTDLTALKVRPAVVLTPEPGGPDLVVAYVSSVVPVGAAPRGSFVVTRDHPEFRGTGLRQTSVVRGDKLMTIARSRVRRRLGRLGPSLLASLDAELRSGLGL